MSKEFVNGYALALFSLAKEEKKLKKVKEDANELVSALAENKDYLTLLSSKGLDFESKESMIVKAFKGTDKNIVNFLLLTAQKGIAKIALPTLEKLVKLINEELKIKEGVVYSTIKLTPKQIEGLEDKVAKQLGFKPTLINKLDAELISGFKVIVGDEVIEDSVTSRLEQIKNELLREEN